MNLNNLPDDMEIDNDIQETFSFNASIPVPNLVPIQINPPQPINFPQTTPLPQIPQTTGNPFPYMEKLRPRSKNRIPYTDQISLDNDEHLEIKPQTENLGKSDTVQDLISVSIKSYYPKLHLGKLSREVPCIISLEGGNADIEAIENNRQGIDLIFVVDVSGSMSGVKLELVKITMVFVITVLKASDRVSIVSFGDSAYIECPLTVMNENGKIAVGNVIKKLSINGGTHMESGICAALHLLKDRRIINQSTAIFMLSDGVDNNVPTINARIQERLAFFKPKITGEFRLHTFGYGRDHDSRVMGKLAEDNSGNFYYIENERSVTDAFGNCLGELVALAAKNVQVSLTTLPCEVPFNLSKVYSSNGDTSFPMPDIYFNDKKDSVFVLNFPAVDEEVKSTIISPVEAVVTYMLKSGEKSNKKVLLSIEIVAEGNEGEKNPEVAIEYYRVKGAEVLKEVMVFADANKLKEAKELAKNAEIEIQKSSVASNPKIQALIKDLNDAQARVESRNTWESGGRAQVNTVSNCHYFQKSSNNCVSYQNPVQAMYSINANSYMTSNMPLSAPQSYSPNQPFSPNQYLNSMPMPMSMPLQAYQQSMNLPPPQSGPSLFQGPPPQISQKGPQAFPSFPGPQIPPGYSSPFPQQLPPPNVYPNQFPGPMNQQIINPLQPGFQIPNPRPSLNNVPPVQNPNLSFGPPPNLLNNMPKPPSNP